MWVKRSYIINQLLCFVIALCCDVAGLGQEIASERPPVPCGELDLETARCRLDAYPPIRLAEGNYAVIVELNYRLNDVVAGAQSIKLTINIVSPSAQAHNLKIKEFMPRSSQGEWININPLGDCDQSASVDTGFLTRECPYEIVISAKAPPQAYDIPLKLAAENKANGSAFERQLSFPLLVGVGPGQPGLLQVEEVADCCQLGILRKDDDSLRVKLLNLSPYYELYLRKVEINSTPTGLLGNGKPIVFTEPIKLGRGSADPVNLSLPKASVFGHLLNGFTKNKELKLDFSYEDKYGRPIPVLSHTVKAENLNLTLSQPAWLLCVLIGVTVGALIKLYLKRQEGSLAHKIKWALGTILIGALVSILSLVLKVGVDVSTLNISNDHPLGVMVIGMVSALSGTAILQKLVPFIDKSALSGDAQPAPREVNNE